MIDESTVERVAAALYRQEWANWENTAPWKNAQADDKEYWMKSARAALAALPQPVSVGTDEFIERANAAFVAFWDEHGGCGEVDLLTNVEWAAILQQLDAEGIRIVKAQPTKAPAESEGK